MSVISDFFLRARLRAEDLARTRGLSRWPALARLILSVATRRNDIANSVARYLVSSHPSQFQHKLSSIALAASRRTIAGIPAHSPTRITRSIVVKSPASPAERGILIVSFESELEKLILSSSFPEVERAYQIVFLPTWQPAYSNALFLLAARASLPYYLMPALPDDQSLNRIFGDACIGLPFQASSWVPSKALEIQSSKDIDILVLANFSKYKRHWKLFEALDELPATLKVVLAGRPWGGRTADTLRREARAFSSDARIQIIQDASDLEIATLLSRARLFCAMSYKEGSYIAVAEALIAGTPVAIYANAIVGSKAFVQPESGFLLDPKVKLAPQLINALQRSATLDSSKWARNEISAEASSRKFNVCMRSIASQRGLPWTQDAAAFFCRNFLFDYADPADRSKFAGDYQRLAGMGLSMEGFS